jgi:hypothetical protein
MEAKLNSAEKIETGQIRKRLISVATRIIISAIILYFVFLSNMAECTFCVPICGWQVHFFRRNFVNCKSWYQDFEVAYHASLREE